ncbi:MAG: GNAT family acetyltransferase [Lachnospiraceae bacterium]|nr:GNAT family acetyltransferase [Lachnospiraceae bacterium]
MIDPNIIHVNYIKKEPQSGSYQGMRYMFTKGKNDDGDCMNVTIWPEPLCYVKTPDSQKEMKQFPLTLEGRDLAVEWLNEQYEAQKDRWKP